MALVHAPDREDSRPDDEFGADLGEILLMASDLLDPGDFPIDLEASRPLVTANMVRNHLLNMVEQVRYLIPRTSILYRKLPFEEELRRDHDFVDVPALFQEATDVSLRDYLAFGFAIFLWFLDPSRESVNPDVLFSQSRIDSAWARRLLRRFTFTRESIQERLASNGQADQAFYDFLPFVSQPLCEVRENVVVPTHLGYLANAFTNGIFWEISNHLANRRSEGDKFRRFFGKLHEAYVRAVVRRAIPALPSGVSRVFGDIEYPTPKGTARSSDVVILYPGTAIFIEATATRFRLTTSLSREVSHYDDDINRIVVKKARQLTERIRDFKSGRYTFDGVGRDAIERIVPVIATVYAMPRGRLVDGPTSLAEDRWPNQPHLHGTHRLPDSAVGRSIFCMRTGPDPAPTAMSEAIRRSVV